MNKYLAVLGRQPEISLSELDALFDGVEKIGPELATFLATEGTEVSIARLGGVLKLAEKLMTEPLEFLKNLPEGKITLGISDYSKGANARKSAGEALRLKRILSKAGRSVRVLPSTGAAISTATAHHNQLSEKKNHIELIRADGAWWRLVGVQNITAYARRDQERPARDARVGMLPPKLAQILINLCGPLPSGSRILDPFCGTGVVLQEASALSYRAYGTDISERMVEYSQKNLEWFGASGYELAVGDAAEFQWAQPINAVASECYLGQPMSKAPAEIKLKEEKQKCAAIILGFLKNLSGQIKPETPVAIAVPAWLRPDGAYSRLPIIDEIEKMGYNVVKNKFARAGLLYHRDGQVVAREIIVLRKK